MTHKNLSQIMSNNVLVRSNLFGRMIMRSICVWLYTLSCALIPTSIVYDTFDCNKNIHVQHVFKKKGILEDLNGCRCFLFVPYQQIELTSKMFTNAQFTPRKPAFAKKSSPLN